MNFESFIFLLVEIVQFFLDLSGIRGIIIVDTITVNKYVIIHTREYL